MAIMDGCVRKNLIFTLILVLNAWVGLEPSQAEEPFATATTGVSVSLRDALFDEVAADAERYQRQFGIVKRVVRLVRPTIVHIDALADTKDDSEVIDEAGSGIIFKIDGQFYVLTNRHVVDASSLDKLKIRTDDGEYLKLLKLWADPSTDVAVVQVAARNLLSARIGDSDQVF